MQTEPDQRVAARFEASGDKKKAICGKCSHVDPRHGKGEKSHDLMPGVVVARNTPL
jgi:hypothetical protein